MPQPEIIYRLPPCPAYDVEAMESWLYDMAQEGLFLEDLALGIASFQRGEPRTVHYRLEPTRKEFSLRDMGLYPDQGERDLHAWYGWQYITTRGDFSLYKNEREGPREMNTDPVVQALAMNTARKWSFVSLCGVFYDLWLWWDLYGSGLSLMPELSPMYLVCTISFLTYFLLYFIMEAVHLHRLYRRLKEGQPLDHSVPWRTRAIQHHFWRFLAIVTGVLWLLTLFVTHAV